MIAVLLVVCSAVFSGSGGPVEVAGAPRHRQKLLHFHEQFGAFVTVMCEAKCWNTSKKNRCVKACLMKGVDKPGSCPGSDSTATEGSRFAFACLEACETDVHCPGLTKCCSHRCGVTCQLPKNLNAVKDVPEPPTNLLFREKRRKRKRIPYLKWQPGESPPGTVLFLVEERHHIGKHLLENRMSYWTPFVRTNKPKANLKKTLKPGRWYQFRVAAVNRNGTKGYSDLSRFITSSGPRPPNPPENMTVDLLSRSNNSMDILVKWIAPASDLPIQKYKVYWSRRLEGIQALDSVLVQHKTVPETQRKVALKNLDSNSLYFLQVQAFSEFGTEKLKGEKSSLLLDTARFSTETSPSSHSNNRPHKPQTIQKSKN